MTATPWCSSAWGRSCCRTAGRPSGRARRVLEIGCGTGFLTALIRRANPQAQLVALDLEFSLLQQARLRAGGPGVHFLAADGEAVPGGSCDLIVSNSVFQWFSRPGETLKEYFRLLRPGGSLAFAVLGPATFRELAVSFHEAAFALSLTAAPPVAAVSFPGREAWQTFLMEAGFQGVSMHREICIETHPSVQDFLRALQATGATNPIPQPLSPRLFRRMATIYRGTFGKNGAIPATYEVIWALARR